MLPAPALPAAADTSGVPSATVEEDAVDGTGAETDADADDDVTHGVGNAADEPRIVAAQVSSHANDREAAFACRFAPIENGTWTTTSATSVLSRRERIRRGTLRDTHLVRKTSSGDGSQGRHGSGVVNRGHRPSTSVGVKRVRLVGVLKHLNTWLAASRDHGGHPQVECH